MFKPPYWFHDNIKFSNNDIKKLWATIQKKIGKNVQLPTRAEIQTNKYRENKGLPPLKKKN